ncbi:MAG: GIY-YIG nuclease family protein [Candidatus Liptonbacteria bacterium]|nr:GIY-YIG nuclease family protein [Candidatus Liptonbacteria bacterium]
MMAYFVYILLCDQKTFYVGRTQNITKRLNEHRQRFSPYTKKFADIELVYVERCSNVKEAEKRELQLKGWSVAKKKALIAGNKLLLQKLSRSHELDDATGKKS